MTPTATYIASENCLQEQPNVSKPTSYPEQYPISTPQYDYYKLQHHEYLNHLASLRRIPCSPECKGLWADQQKVVENVDYEVKYTYEPGQSIREIFALPLVPVSENIKSIWTTANNVGFEVFKQWMRDNYSLTKR